MARSLHRFVSRGLIAYWVVSYDDCPQSYGHIPDLELWAKLMRSGKEDMAEISEHKGTAVIHFIDKIMYCDVVKTTGKIFSFGKA
jgi:hypothetical protein